MKKLRSQLKIDEGIVKSVYKDSLGYYTIGVGRLIDKRKGGGLSQVEIDFLLDNDIRDKKAELDKALPWAKNLDEARYGVLLNMSFQMGVGGLLKFKNTLKYIRKGWYQSASKGMLKSLWARQTPNRAKKMSRQMATGRWQ